MADNRALRTAADTGKPVVPVYILDHHASRAPGAARRWWLHHSLKALSLKLEGAGAGLLLRQGPTAKVVSELLDATGADLVLWNRRYEPAAVETDRALKAWLATTETAADDFDGQLLHEPSTFKSGNGGHYKVFTPFLRALQQRGEPRDPVAEPHKLRAFDRMPKGVALGDLKLLPLKPDWSAGLRAAWEPGESGAHAALAAFLEDVDGYAKRRDFPADASTSRLSPHLANGEITPHQILHALQGARIPPLDADKFRAELAWREFAWHQLSHFPDLATKNYQPGFERLEWRPAPGALKAWQRGETGYPIVDAGMRQLWQTGWMHNRIRMVVASFLTKHLLIDWREGEQWFWDTLVDADPANNPFNWQWVAGSGVDPSPYYRVFNPTLQGEKFDPEGEYVRRYVPVLAGLPADAIHEPARDKHALEAAGLKLARDYPVAVVEHSVARERALTAYKSMRGAS